MGVKIVDVDKSGFFKWRSPTSRRCQGPRPHAAKIQQTISAIK